MCLNYFFGIPFTRFPCRSPSSVLLAFNHVSDVRRPGSWWVSGGGYTYYWSGRLQGHPEGMAVAVADRLGPVVTEVTPVNERIVRLRTSHTLCVVYLVSVYAPTE